MTSYGLWDGSTCANCSEEAGDGYDSDHPCEECGWFRGRYSGERYPPGFCASSWRYATERIDQLRQEFPEYPREMIAKNVEMAGENDMDGNVAREGLVSTKAAQKVLGEFPDLSEDTVLWVVSMLYKPDVDMLPGKDDLDSVRDVLTSLKSKREEVKAKEVEGSFNYDFDLVEGEILIEIIQRLNGCFHCKKKGADKRCTKCKVAVYCGKECQALSWKDKEAPHKDECKCFCENTAPIREGSDPGPIPIALRGINLIASDRVLDIAMHHRTIAFLNEAARVCTEPKYMSLQIAVIFNLDMARLQASASLIDGKMNRIDVNIVIFKTVGVDSHLQQRIHPPNRGPGDIPEGARKKVLLHLKTFFQEAHDRGLEVANITCGRATMWLCEGEGKRKLIEANGGRRMMISPSMQYAGPGLMGNSANMSDFAEAAMGEECKQS